MPASFDPDDPADVARFLAAMKNAHLPITPLPAGKGFVRLFEAHHGDLLGTGPSSARYSDPRRGTIEDDKLFSVLYAGRDLRTAFEETVLRDKTTGNLGPFPISHRELESWRGGVVRTRRPLRLVDLRETEGRWRSLGSSIEEIKGASYRASRLYSLAFHENKSAPDGIVYQSRYTGGINIAIYGRAIRNGLEAGEMHRLLDMDLAPVFHRLGVVVVTDTPEEDA